MHKSRELIILIHLCGKSGPLSKKRGQETFFQRIGQVSSSKMVSEVWEEGEIAVVCGGDRGSKRLVV